MARMATKGELVFVEYDYDGEPMRMVTREKGGFSEWMRVPSEHDGCVYLRHDGHSARPEVEMHPWADTTDRTAVWWKAPIALSRFVRWAKDADGREVAVRAVVESDADLAALGRFRLAAPKAGDPFAGVEELGQYESLTYCVFCGDLRDDPENYCDHLFDTEDGVGGPGADEWGGKVPPAMQRLVRRLGCHRHLLRHLTDGKFPRPHRHGSMLGPSYVRMTFAGMALDAAFDRIVSRPGPNEHELTEGLRWLESMDEKTGTFTAVVMRWLREEIATQNARRASGECCYAVKATQWWNSDTTHGHGLSFAEAAALAKQLRSDGTHGDVRVVRQRVRAKAARAA